MENLKGLEVFEGLKNKKDSSKQRVVYNSFKTRNIICVYGMPGCGKSLLTLQLLKNKNISFFYYNMDGEEEYIDKLINFNKDCFIYSQDLEGLYEDFNIANNGLKSLELLLEENMKNIPQDVVIFDGLIDLMPECVDINNYQQVSSFFKVIRRVIKKYDKLFIFVLHSTKRESNVDFMGSQAISSFVDFLAKFKEIKNGTTREVLVEFKKNRSAKIKSKIIKVNNNGLIERIEDVKDDLEITNEEERILLKVRNYLLDLYFKKLKELENMGIEDNKHKTITLTNTEILKALRIEMRGMDFGHLIKKHEDYLKQEGITRKKLYKNRGFYEYNFDIKEEDE